LCQVADAGACRGQAVRFAASVRGDLLATGQRGLPGNLDFSDDG